MEAAVTAPVTKQSAIVARAMGTSRAFAQTNGIDSECEARVAEGLSACVHRFRSVTDTYTCHSSVFGDAKKYSGFESV